LGEIVVDGCSASQPISLSASKATASFAVVDAIDDHAVKFYQRFEFQAFPDHQYKLFRTITNIAQTFG
jgi:hypothetical protein